MTQEEERRIIDNGEQFDGAFFMAIVYTIIYAGMVLGLCVIEIPDKNADIIKLLVGAMTAIQTMIVQYFFGNTKSAEKNLRYVAVSKERTDSVLRNAVSTSVQSTTNGKHL